MNLQDKIKPPEFSTLSFHIRNLTAGMWRNRDETNHKGKENMADQEAIEDVIAQLNCPAIPGLAEVLAEIEARRDRMPGLEELMKGQPYKSSSK